MNTPPKSKLQKALAEHKQLSETKEENRKKRHEENMQLKKEALSKFDLYMQQIVENLNKK